MNFFKFLNTLLAGHLQCNKLSSNDHVANLFFQIQCKIFRISIFSLKILKSITLVHSCNWILHWHNECLGQANIFFNAEMQSTQTFTEVGTGGMVGVPLLITFNGICQTFMKRKTIINKSFYPPPSPYSKNGFNPLLFPKLPPPSNRTLAHLWNFM